MIIVEPSYELMYFPGTPTRLIEKCGRTCYKSEEKTSEGSDERFVKMILKRGHESVIEHVSATVKFVCDRGVSHEIVRHRIASYSQESTRYCNYSSDKFGGHVTFVKPCFLPGCPIGEFKSIDVFMEKSVESEINHHSEVNALHLWGNAMLTSEHFYFGLLSNKENSLQCDLHPQEARSVLPNSLKTEIVCTFNFREWRHFFKLRTSKAAHPQMRELTVPLLKRFKILFPVIFDDISVED